MRKLVILFFACLLWSVSCADTLSLPGSLTVIEEEAFYGDTSLDEVVLPEGITEIGSLAFAESSLRTVNLPISLNSIADDAFDESVIITATGGMAYIWAVEHGYIQPEIVLNDESVALEYDSDSKNICLSICPEYYLASTGSLEIHIGDVLFTTINAETSVDEDKTILDAFLSNDDVVDICLPWTGMLGYADIRYTANFAEDTKSLEGDRCYFSSPKSDFTYSDLGMITGYTGSDTDIALPNDAIGFAEISNDLIQSIIVPEGYQYFGTFSGFSALSSVWIADGYSLPDAIFDNCTSLTQVVLPQDLTALPVNAFRNCSGLESVDLPSTVTQIGEYAFSGCTSLQTLVLPDGILDIGSHAFGNCTALQTLNLPSGIETMGANPFAYCSGLTIESDRFTVQNDILYDDTLLICALSRTADQIQEGTVSIAPYAFEGSQFDSIVLPDGILDIEDGAFADCASLISVSVPASVQYFGSDIFANNENPLIISTTPGSEALYYAMQNSLDYDADTTCRALLIGNSVYQAVYKKLNAPTSDAAAMSATLNQTGTRTFTSTIKENLTANEILSAVSTTFADADETDISLFFYAGHGFSSSDSEKNGALVGIDGYSYVYANDLRQALDTIPGRKIVIIDACYSGGLIGRGASEDPAVSFMSAFLNGSMLRSRSNLAVDSYFVLTASAGTQESYEVSGDSYSMGVFSYYVSRGLGYNRIQKAYITPQADTNKDGIVTFAEEYEYARDNVSTYVGKSSITQSVQVYPDECDWFGLKRP